MCKEENCIRAHWDNFTSNTHYSFTGRYGSVYIIQVSVKTPRGKGHKSWATIAIPRFVGKLRNTKEYVVQTLLVLTWSPPAESINKTYVVSFYGIFATSMAMIWYAVIYDMIWDDVVWYDMIYVMWYDMRWYDIWYDMLWYDVWYIWCDVIWFDIWYDAIQYDIWFLFMALSGKLTLLIPEPWLTTTPLPGHRISW